MTILDIRIYPDPVLKQPTAAVTDFGSSFQRLVDDMCETMYAANGAGLAAPQIGVLQRVTVIDVTDDRSQLIHLVNPEIISRAGSTSIREGCLSIPEYRESVPRSRVVTVRALDRHGAPLEIVAEDLLAVCIQHEIDHLDGILFIDRISRLKRELFRRWYKKRQEES